MAIRFFGQLDETEAIVLERQSYIPWHRCRKMALARACNGEYFRCFLDVGHGLASDKDADAFILAGTGPGLVFYGQTRGDRVRDALDIHVDILAKLACDDICPQDLRTAK